MIQLFKIDHFIAHISAYHPLTFFRNLKNLMVLTVDISSRWELETLCHTLLCFCTSRAVETVYLLVYSIYLYLWVWDGYSKSIMGNFLKDTAILVKQLLLKVWHNAKVYHSLICCFSSALRLLFKACVHYFHQIFIFSQNGSPSKTMKMLFISSKKLFSFWRYSIFCISVLPSFSTYRPLL